MLKTVGGKKERKKGVWGGGGVEKNTHTHLKERNYLIHLTIDGRKL